MTAEATCVCGACRITLPQTPTEASDCNCSLCRRLGALWSYHPAQDLAISGPTDSFARAEGASLDIHRCAQSGCVTHWSARPGTFAEGRVGVNARLFDGFDPWTAPLRRIDGAHHAWR
ncbi:GFA family protein [Paracoccus suum]|uniref:GFA family protein n=1 Tax=Paracoccus suum TaxID=2259340 RepID=UPI0013B05119|nr:GFA family protein [Paracoccus suum]